MFQINYKSKYLKYKTKYLFIKNNQMDQEFKSSLNLLKGGAASSVEEQIKQLEKQLQELDKKYNTDLKKLETYVKELEIPGYHYDSINTPPTNINYYNQNKNVLDDQYKQDKQKILEKIQLLKSPLPLIVIQSAVLPVPLSVVPLSVVPLSTISSQSASVVQQLASSQPDPINTHYFETRDAER